MRACVYECWGVVQNVDTIVLESSPSRCVLSGRNWTSSRCVYIYVCVCPVPPGICVYVCVACSSRCVCVCVCVLFLQACVCICVCCLFYVSCLCLVCVCLSYAFLPLPGVLPVLCLLASAWHVKKIV